MSEKATRATSMLIRGRFEHELHSTMERINESISFDRRMVDQDIQCSRAHTKMLIKQGIVSKDDGTAILGGLDQIAQEVASGEFEYSTKLEDIHMNIEARLKQLVGETAGKLPTARSRNDQVATDFKMWVRAATDETAMLVQELNRALLALAKGHVDTILPGYTHLQIGQPVNFSHHLLAYVEMFHRDLETLRDAKRRMNLCPLGAAALAGTHFPIDRNHTAALLGFDGPTRNSIDSVSDRDFALDYLAAITKVAVHLSRIAEEIVLWMSAGFGFVKLSDQWTTGSSIMPQKRNPDAAEIIRGKFGRILGSFVAVSTMMKALPLTFSKDMQEDKENTFDAFDTITISLQAMIGMVKELKPQKENMLRMAQLGHSTATDLADWLVANRGVPFRTAHEITGRLVQKAEKQGCQLPDLPLEELRAEYSGFDETVFDFITVENSVYSKQSFGGASSAQVSKQLEYWQREYSEGK